MLTGLDDTESIERAYRCGADDFITKADHWNLLIHRVRFNLRAASARAALAASRGQPGQRPTARPHGQLGMGPVTAGSVFGAVCPAPATAARPVTQYPPRCPHRAGRSRRIASSGNCPGARSDPGWQLPVALLLQRWGGCATLEETGRAISNGRGPRLEAIVQDVSQAVANEERMRFLSYHDTTTGLPSRQFFLEVANHTLEQARRTSTGCALLFIDLDHFKGNQRPARKRCRRRHAQNDRFPDCRMCSVGDLGGACPYSGRHRGGRPGGEISSSCCCPVCVVKPTLPQLADRFARRDSSAGAYRSRDSIITASIGLTLFPRDGGDIATLLENAEQTCRTAQKRGRDVHAFYSEDVGQVASARLRLENEIRRALSQNNLCFITSPGGPGQWASGRCGGAGSLAAPGTGLLYPGFHSPGRGKRPPSRLGHRVPRARLRPDCGSGPAACSRTVRPSPSICQRSALEDDLLVRLVAATRSPRIPRGTVWAWRVTGTSLMHQTSGGRPLDFCGAGFLLAPRRFRDGLLVSRLFETISGGPDQDRSQFRGGPGERRSWEAIVAAIVSLATRLGLEVVAEGWRPRANGLSRRYGLPLYAQGYYISRPGPAEALEPWLRL